jgi:AraC-like DNA-binding protein
MLSSAVHTFSDPDDYADSIRGTDAQLTITGRGTFEANIIRVDLHHLWMQRLADNLPRVMHLANRAGRLGVAFRTQPGPRLRMAGLEMQQSNIIVCNGDQNCFQQSDGLAGIGAMSLPAEEMSSIGSVIVGHELILPESSTSSAPKASAMAKLRHLHGAASHLALRAPEVIEHSESARSLEQALIEAMATCLSTGEVRENRSALRQHATIMRRFRRAIEEKSDQAIYLPELCASIGVSERTLRICCQEQLGLSPKRYLMLRRMHLAHRALRENASAATTVTEIATRYGFWQFGRFAGEYRSIFEELPSATLARSSEAQQSACGY